jgi:Tfp pilus assembly ATPase PilU
MITDNYISALLNNYQAAESVCHWRHHEQHGTVLLSHSRQFVKTIRCQLVKDQNRPGRLAAAEVIKIELEVVEHVSQDTHHARSGWKVIHS